MSDSETDAFSDVDSFATIEMNISELNHMICEMYGQAEELEEHLATLHVPLEGLHVSQFGQLPFLAATPFRHATFKIKPPGFPGVDLERRFPFHEICSILRNYLVSTGAVLPDGTVRLSAQLQTLFETQETTLGFVSLLGMLRKVCV